MIALLQLRKDLDSVVGPTARGLFFKELFQGEKSRVAVQRTHSLAEAEYTAQQLRFSGLTAKVEQTAMYPNFHTVWVEL